MLRRLRITSLYLLLVLAGADTASAQTFGSRAELPEVKQDGFYAIPVTPAMGSLLRPGYPDIRILDNKGKEVPYLLQTEERYLAHTVFRGLPFKLYLTHRSTQVEIHNNTGGALNHVKLVLTNTATSKRGKLTGSNDGKNWFVVLDAFALQVTPEADKTETEQFLSFPFTDYTYYRLELDDSASAPVEVRRILVSSNVSESGRFSHLPDPKREQRDSSDKCSYITLTFPYPCVVDELKATLAGPGLYHRDYEVLVKDSVQRKHRWVYSYRVLSSGVLDSRYAPVIRLSGEKLQQCVLRIVNNDNPPLQVTSVAAAQLTHYLVCWLEAGSGYAVTMGAWVQAPDYDLEFFRDKIPASLPLLEAGPVQRQSKEMKKEEPKDSKNLVWAGLALLVVVVFIGSRNMLREMRKKRDS